MTSAHSPVPEAAAAPLTALPLEALPDAILVVDGAGRISAANGVAAALFGHELPDLLGRTTDDLVADALKEGHRQRRSAYMEAPRRLEAVIESRGRRRNGTEFPMELAVAPLATGAGVQLIVTIRDVSHHRRIEEALRDSRAAVERTAAARDRFFATMSHDLRAPLNAIIGFAGTLLMKLPGPLTEAQEHQLGIIRSSGQQLLALLNDVIDLAKMESGRAAPRRERFDCAALVEEVATRLRHHAERKHLTLDVNGGQGQQVVSDRRALQQILHQLLDNAIKFSERGAVNMDLRTLQREGCGWIEISVTDTGVGLAQADRDLLRQAFQDMEAPIRVGNGLGLHVARKFAQLIGGRLELESRPDAGSRFSLLFPTE